MLVLGFSVPCSVAQTTPVPGPVSDPQAVSLARQSITVLTGLASITDVTLTGNVTWADGESGTATLKALGTTESRIDLILSSGTRTEIRDAQTGANIGKWVNPDNSSGMFAPHNCWTDAVWFFPALGSLIGGPNMVLSYVGQESRNASLVQHIRVYNYYQWNSFSVGPTPQQLSTIDFYLDKNTLVPVAMTFNTHPDNDAMTNLLVEVDFSEYRYFNGVPVPMRIQKYQQGSLMMDVVVIEASFNSGLLLSAFAVN